MKLGERWDEWFVSVYVKFQLSSLKTHRMGFCNCVSKGEPGGFTCSETSTSLARRINRVRLWDLENVETTNSSQCSPSFSFLGWKPTESQVNLVGSPVQKHYGRYIRTFGSTAGDLTHMIESFNHTSQICFIQRLYNLPGHYTDSMKNIQDEAHKRHLYTRSVYFSSIPHSRHACVVYGIAPGLFCGRW